MLNRMKVVQNPELMDKAVLYLRYSSENQTENSIEGPRRECMEFAKKNNMIVLAEYIDRAMTGTNDNRPEFRRMIRDSGKEAFGNVIVWKSDRFSRDMLDAVRYERELGKNGVKLLSATEANLDTPKGTLLKSVSLGYNQFYSEELSVKVKRGQRENVINGKTLGGYLPFGYKKEGEHYVIDEKEGPIAQEAFHLYGERSCSIKSIVEKFAREGKTRNDGRAITHCCLEKVLASEKYIGVLKCEGARNENAMPPLVSKELFDLCQKKRTKRKHKNFKLKGKEEYYLSGKVFCSSCGEQYLGESGIGHSGRFYTYYKCHEAQKQLLQILSDDETRRYIADCIYSEQKKEAPEITSMKKRRSEVEKKIGNFVKAIGMGIVTESTKSALLSLESERSRLDEELSKLSLNSKSFSKDEIRWAMNELSAYDITDPKAKSALLDCFVKRVEIGKDRNITAEFDLFGYETGFSMGSEAFKEVRKNPALLRHLISIRTLYIHR